VSLQGDGSLAENACEFLARLSAFGLLVDDDRDPVDFNRDSGAFDDDFVSPPLVVFCGCMPNIGYGVDAPGFSLILVGYVYLAFEAIGRPAARLVRCVEEDASVRAGLGHYFEF